MRALWVPNKSARGFDTLHRAPLNRAKGPNHALEGRMLCDAEEVLNGGNTYLSGVSARLYRLATLQPCYAMEEVQDVLQNDNAEARAGGDGDDRKRLRERPSRELTTTRGKKKNFD